MFYIKNPLCVPVRYLRSLHFPIKVKIQKKSTVKYIQSAPVKHMLHQYITYITPIFEKELTRAVIECELNPPASALTETSIFLHMPTHRRTNRQADSSIPPKTFVLRGYY